MMNSAEDIDLVAGNADSKFDSKFDSNGFRVTSQVLQSYIFQMTPTANEQQTGVTR